MSVAPSYGTMVTRCGGKVRAAFHWLQAKCDWPIMPMRPLHQGSVARCSMVSWIASPSLRETGSQSPSERPEPGRSRMT